MGCKQHSTATDKSVYIVFISLLLDLLAFTMILPLFPSLLEHYRVNDNWGLYSWLSNRIHYFQELVGAPEKFNSVIFGGFLGSMYSFLQFIASPIVGGISDVVGRKPMMLICMVSTFNINLSICTHPIWLTSYGGCILPEIARCRQKY